MIPERSYSLTPDRMIMVVGEGFGIALTQELAQQAVTEAQRVLPKITGAMSGTLRPVFGEGYFGIFFPDKRIWYLEKGTRPFTMNNLQNKVIPMWVDDPDGTESKKNPKAKTRMTVDGRRQTLIFRRAARKGERKMAWRRGQLRSVPRSYPGAPGRISNRLGSGRIGTPNGGVRWRHPGIQPRNYLNYAMESVAVEFGFEPKELLLVDSATFSSATRS